MCVHVHLYVYVYVYVYAYVKVNAYAYAYAYVYVYGYMSMFLSMSMSILSVCSSSTFIKHKMHPRGFEPPSPAVPRIRPTNAIRRLNHYTTGAWDSGAQVQQCQARESELVLICSCWPRSKLISRVIRDFKLS